MTGKNFASLNVSVPMRTVQLHPINIGRVIQNGIIFDLKNWSTDPMNTDSLPQRIQHLFTLLQQRKISYVFVGSVALLSYIEGRNTQDLDLVMAASALSKLPEIKITSRDLYFARGEFEGLQIALLLTENLLFRKGKQKYSTVRHFEEQDIRTATVEGLLLLKLYALPSLYRQGSFSKVGIYENDIATLLHDYPVAVNELLQELAHYLIDNDIVEVRRIVGEIEQRIARYKKGSNQKR